MPVPGVRRRRGPAPGPRRAASRGQPGHRGGGQHPRAVRSQLQPRAGSDPVVARRVGRAPPPHPREDAHAGRAGRRVRRRPRGAPHGAADRLRRRGHQPVPRLRDDRGPDRHRPDGHRSGQGAAQLHQGVRQGPAQGHVEDGHLDGRLVHRGADLRGHRPVARAGRRVLHGHGQPARRDRPRRAGPRSGRAPRAGLPGPPRGACPPAAAGGRRVPVAPRGRVPPLQPRDGLQAAALDAGPALRGLQGVHIGGQRAGPPAGDAPRPVPVPVRRAAAGAHRRGRAGERDRAAVRHRGDVLRIDLGRGPRDPGHRHEPDRRQVEHRRRWRGRRPLRARRQR